MDYDALYNVLLQTPPEDLISMCKVSHDTMTICSNSQFWIDKLTNEELKVPVKLLTNIKEWLLYYYKQQLLDYDEIIILILKITSHIYMDFQLFHYLEYITINNLKKMFKFIDDTNITIDTSDHYYNLYKQTEKYDARLNFTYHQGIYIVYFTLHVNDNIKGKLLGNKVNIDFETMFNFIKFVDHNNMSFFSQGKYIKNKNKYLATLWETIIDNNF
jgi:hypothetical protein